MKKLIFPLTLTAILLSPLSHAGEYVIYGVGSFSCGKWSQVQNASPPIREDADIMIALHMWLSGFVSGAGWSGMKMPKSDHNAFEGFIDKYCQENPLDDVSDAAAALVLELTKRAE